MKSILDPVEAFRDAMAGKGCIDSSIEIVGDGKLHRFGPKARYWYVLYADPYAGAFGDWKTGLSETWTLNCGKLPDADWARIREEIERQKAERVEQAAAQHRAKADEARRYLASCPPAEEATPYLSRKRVKPCAGLLVERDALIVPVLSPDDNQPMSFQRINPDGTKKFMPGAKAAGGYFPIKGKDGALLVAEGIATALSLHEATGLTVIVAFSAGNLESVAVMVRHRYPDRQMIICADDDAETAKKTGQNPGIEMATNAAMKVNGLVAVPGRPGDFNDLHTSGGSDAVKAAIAAATSPVAPQAQAKNEPEPWPSPVRFDQGEAPPIPLDVLPEPSRSFGDAVAKAIQVSSDLVCMCIIGAVATAAQGKYRVVIRPGYSEPVNVYIAIALPPAERKSAGLETCKRPIVEWETEQARILGSEIRRLESEKKNAGKGD